MAEPATNPPMRSHRRAHALCSPLRWAAARRSRSRPRQAVLLFPQRRSWRSPEGALQAEGRGARSSGPAALDGGRVHGTLPPGAARRFCRRRREEQTAMRDLV